MSMKRWFTAGKVQDMALNSTVNGAYHSAYSRASEANHSKVILHSSTEYNALDEANLRWNNLLKLDISSEMALSHLASNYLSVKNLESAKSTLSQYESLPLVCMPERLLELKARFYGVSNKHEVAIEYWEKALCEGADVLRCKRAILNHALSARKFKLAQSIISDLEASQGSEEEFKIAKARLNIYQLNWSAAILILEDIDSFIQKRKTAVELLYRCYMNDYRHQSALALCESLESELYPQRRFMLGKVKYRLNDYREAIDLFTSKIVDDENIESRVWLIKSLYAANEMNSAVEQADLASRLAGLNDLSYAKCWEAAGKLEVASKHYTKAVKLAPNSENLQALVNFLFRYRYWGKAYSVMESYAKEVKDIPELADIRATIIEACVATGTALPKNKRELKKFQFRSSEAMVTGIVDTILARPAELELVRKNDTKLKKVVLLINSLGPGGAERQVVNLANGLADTSNHEVSLLCTYLNRIEQDCFYLKDVSSNVQVSEYFDRTIHLTVDDVPELSQFSKYIEKIQPLGRQQLILHLAQKLASLKPDVVHGWLDETFINTALVCRMLGIECAVGRWGSMPPGVGRTTTERDQNNIEYLQHAYKQISRLPNLTYCSNSRLTGDAYADLLGIESERVEIIYNGIDEKKLEHDAAGSTSLKEELGIPEHCKVIGTVFRISDEKRPKLWIDVARALMEKYPDLHYVMVGAGPLAGQMEEYVRTTGCRNFHLVGKQTNVGAWMKMFDLFVLTSRVEGVSNAVLEAQFCSCPVIAPNVGGLGEAIQHESTGTLLEDHSVASFTSAIGYLLENPDVVKTYAKNARIFAKERFSISSMVKNYKNIFGLDL